MKIICPHCHSEYDVDKKEILKDGRKTKCFSCESVWVQYADGKAEKIKKLVDFLDEVKRRQDTIKHSLKKNTSNEKLFGKEIKSPLSKNQERELLTALAMGEIHENSQREKSISPIDSSIKNQIKTMDEISNNLSDELKGKEQKGFSQKINRTFLGFTIISLMVIAGLFLHTNRNLIMVLDPKYHEYLMDILKTTDLLFNQLKHYILILKDSFYSYFLP